MKIKQKYRSQKPKSTGRQTPDLEIVCFGMILKDRLQFSNKQSLENNFFSIFPPNLAKFLLTLSSFWQFSPHFLDPLQHHVAMSVKSLHSAKELLVVPAVDEDLGVVLHAVGENPEGPGLKLLLLLGVPLLGSHLVLVAHDDNFDFGKNKSEKLLSKRLFGDIFIDGGKFTLNNI